MNYDQPPDPMIINPVILCPYPLTFGQVMIRLNKTVSGVNRYVSAYYFHNALDQIKYPFMPQKIYNN